MDLDFDLDFDLVPQRVQEALCFMSLDMIKSDQFPCGRSTSQGNQSYKQWKGRMATLQPGGFLFGSHGAESYFMEQPMSKDCLAQEYICRIKYPLVYTLWSWHML